MKWSELPEPWQVCFSEAWAGFQAGSLPIGAAIFDKNRQLIARGRNHIYDDQAGSGQITMHQLAHAEMNALLQADRRHFDLHSCTLYTSMEPCPLCMGAIYMSGIRTVHFAARDGYAGSSNLLGTTPYLSRKRIAVKGPSDPILEIIFLGVQSVAERRRLHITGVDLFETVIGGWREKCPDGVRFGEFLAADPGLSHWVKAQSPAEQVYTALHEQYSSLFSSGKHDNPN